jgi:hypothetical protein
MSELGVFAVDRGIFEHPLFADEKPYSRFQAWLWLLKEAAWKPRAYNIKGTSVLLQRGQLVHSVRYLATAWGWSKSTVERFLGRLKTETMIGTDSGTGFLVITICNYDAYQRLGVTSRDSDRDAERDSSGTAAGQKRNIKALNLPPNPKGKRARDAGYGNDADPIYADFKANVWAKRWKRKGHEPLPAYRAYAKLAPDLQLACKAAIERCGRMIEASASEETYRPLLASWINKRGWEADIGASEAQGPDWATWVAAYRANKFWNPTALGPEPGNPGCRVPREFLVGLAGAA